MDECYSTIIELTTLPVFIYLTSRANKCCACVLRAPMFFFSPSTKDNRISFLSTRLFIHTQVCNFIDILCHENKEIFLGRVDFSELTGLLLLLVYIMIEREKRVATEVLGDRKLKKKETVPCHYRRSVARRWINIRRRKLLNNNTSILYICIKVMR